MMGTSIWLMKRDDEQCSGNQVVFGWGGRNISVTLCSGNEVVEDFFYSFSPHMDRRGVQ